VQRNNEFRVSFPREYHLNEYSASRENSSLPFLVVGSAAYNLLMICALCISAINATETRKIKLYSVFMVIRRASSSELVASDYAF
jgi:hypothetical protein